ncbi:hypothetical protein [Leptospira interrogans]|uniref:Uncharacterized protein n=1 Tax=Leptospira interrogans serovar Canicola TaxID=211880 RepID=A0AAQ0B0C1_LEPIR|nr:hypothetical protein [Leptospira interrogans]QOI45066.1 hypothetical protein Lepto782_23065 [Leptospira interrogans serovar Canicola]
MNLKTYLLISILFIQNCFWVNLENDSKIIEKKSIRRSLSLSIDFDYKNDEAINLDYQHYALSSLYIRAFRELNIFNQVSYDNPKSDYGIHIKTSLRSNSSRTFFFLLSALTLGVVPLYYTESMGLDVKITNQKTKREVYFTIPLDIHFISYIYATGHYRTFDRMGIASEVAKKVLYEGEKNQIMNFDDTNIKPIEN